MTYQISDEALRRIDGAKPLRGGNYDPYMEEGSHDLVVLSIDTYNDATHGASVRAIFEVEASSAGTAGQKRAQTWNFLKPPKFKDGETDTDRFADFVAKLKGTTISDPSLGQAIRTLINSVAAGGRQEHQLARGLRIKAQGRNVSKATPQNPNPKPFVKPTWFHVADQGDVAGRRAMLEVKHAAALAQPNNSGYQNQYQQQPVPVQPQYTQQQVQHAPPQYTQQQMAPQAPPQQMQPNPYAFAPPAAPAPAQPVPGGFLGQLGTPPAGSQGNGGGFGF